MKPTNVVLIVMITLMLLAAPAGATMTYYSDQTSWEAATSNVFTIDFSDVVVPDVPGYVDYSTTGLQLHDVTFTASPAAEEGLQVIKSAGVCPANAFGAGNYFLCGNTWEAKYFEAALPANVIAVAMNLLPVTYAFPVTLSFSSGDTQVIPALTSATPVFAGFTFDQPVSWVKFEATSNRTSLDNFAYSQITETPEVSTLLLAGLGMISLLFARRLTRFD